MLKNMMGGMGGKLMQQIQKQAQQVQEKIQKIEATGESGGGLVKVKMVGMGVLKEIKISPEAQEEDSEVLEDLILAAVNNATQKLDEERASILPEGMGGLL
jgi:DNA-binding YbaB/EbfC family protein